MFTETVLRIAARLEACWKYDTVPVLRTLAAVDGCNMFTETILHITGRLKSCRKYYAVARPEDSSNSKVV